LALCYDLEAEINGTAHLHKQPYRELHTAASGEHLFVCKRSQRPAPAPGTTPASAMDAIRELLMSQYGIRDQVRQRDGGGGDGAAGACAGGSGSPGGPAAKGAALG
jgi:hypothetical protein